MRNVEEQTRNIKTKYEELKPFLNERAHRIWCASEAKVLGHGGIMVVHKATKVSRATIHKGLGELKGERIVEPERIRGKGGGRKGVTEKDPKLLEDLEAMLDPVTRGDPENPLRWSSKSTHKLAEELNKQGHKITHSTVYSILKSQGFSLKGNKKTNQGREDHPSRDAQFQFINDKTKEFQKENNPVLSVDTKKKENIGVFKNNGEEWLAKGVWEEVDTHDFPNKELGKATPYGVYDIGQNQGWVSIGVSKDTAEFAAQSIRDWWDEMGKSLYKNSKRIMITADCGGSNSYKSRLWKYELQKLSNELGKSILVCHFPPGTSKWNKIEHRMFSFISKNWRGRPLISLQTVVELIGNTTTKSGLVIKTKINKNEYRTGINITDKEFESINIEPLAFQPLWNYEIHPRIV